MASETDILPVMSELLRLSAALAQMQAGLNKIERELATLGVKTDSNAKAIELTRAVVDDMANNGVKVKLG
jgi:hypothetical protein